MNDDRIVWWLQFIASSVLVGVAILTMLLILVSRASGANYTVVASNGPGGPYCAFPGACRLPDGRIVCVYYNGVESGHVTTTAQRKGGGCIAYVTSSDEGKTWAKPLLLLDTEEDDRDPDIAVLRDGRIILSYFRLITVPKMAGDGVYIAEIVEHDGGNFLGAIPTKPDTSGGGPERRHREHTRNDGSDTAQLAPLSAINIRKLQHDAGCSAPVRDYGNGHLLLGSYHLDQPYVIRSTDNGKTWQVHDIPNGGKHLDAETDTIELRAAPQGEANGSVEPARVPTAPRPRFYAALRGAGCNGHYSTSVDGKNWTVAKDIGFVLHCPALHRVGNIVLLAHRVPATAMHYSLDECKTWKGPIKVDSCSGAYPCFVTLKDGSVLIVYYEEGKLSNIRCRRFTTTRNGIQ